MPPIWLLLFTMVPTYKQNSCLFGGIFPEQNDQLLQTNGTQLHVQQQKVVKKHPPGDSSNEQYPFGVVCFGPMVGLNGG